MKKKVVIERMNFTKKLNLYHFAYKYYLQKWWNIHLFDAQILKDRELDVQSEQMKK